MAAHFESTQVHTQSAREAVTTLRGASAFITKAGQPYVQALREYVSLLDSEDTLLPDSLALSERMYRIVMAARRYETALHYRLLMALSRADKPR